MTFTPVGGVEDVKTLIDAIEFTAPIKVETMFQASTVSLVITMKVGVQHIPWPSMSGMYFNEGGWPSHTQVREKSHAVPIEYLAEKGGPKVYMEILRSLYLEIQAELFDSSFHVYGTPPFKT